MAAASTHDAPPLHQAGRADTLCPGSRIGPYEIAEFLGAGRSPRNDAAVTGGGLTLPRGNSPHAQEGVLDSSSSFLDRRSTRSYSVGSTMSVRSVEVITPPMTTVASGR